MNGARPGPRPRAERAVPVPGVKGRVRPAGIRRDLSPAPRAARRATRRRLWPRVLVLLLVLLLPGALTQAVPGAVVPAEIGAPAAEYDVADTALRLPARTGRRPAAPPRPAPPVPLPRPPVGVRPPLPAPGPAPPCPRAPRSVVLRC